MKQKVYSRKHLAYIVAGLCLILFVCLLVSFLPEYRSDIAKASGARWVFVIVEGCIVLGPILVYMYCAFRAIRPTVVEGRLQKTNGNFVNRDRNDLIIRLKGKRYKFPLDSGVDTKLNGVSTETILVRMEVGAFNYPLLLESD